MKQKAGLSTALRSGRDDNVFFGGAVSSGSGAKARDILNPFYGTAEAVPFLQDSLR
jgi:hypothetical protein